MIDKQRGGADRSRSVAKSYAKQQLIALDNSALRTTRLLTWQPCFKINMATELAEVVKFRKLPGCRARQIAATNFTESS